MTKKDELFIYPNPTTGTVNVVINDLFLNTTFDVSLFNLTGKEILSERLSSTSEFQLDMYGFTKGVYVIRVQNGDHIFYK